MNTEKLINFLLGYNPRAVKYKTKEELEELSIKQRILRPRYERVYTNGWRLVYGSFKLFMFIILLAFINGDYKRLEFLVLNYGIGLASVLLNIGWIVILLGVFMSMIYEMLIRVKE